MPKKLMRCIRKVKRKNPGVNAWAVCVKSTGQKPHKRKKSGKK